MFSGNKALLIAAPMLQDYFVDKDTGFPLANGIVTLYRDDARTIFKNWYYQVSTGGAYEYFALDNPMNLSSVGTIQDPNGNDVIPFFYPYDETDETKFQPYYVTVDSVDTTGNPAARQFTRENFPFVAPMSPSVGNPTLQNLIINGEFWRNITPDSTQSTPQTVNLTNITDMAICPSAHDGFSMPDIRFQKSATGSADLISFIKFPLGTVALTNDITPEYYLNVQCNPPLTAESYKYIQIPLQLHINNFQGSVFTFSIQLQNVASTPNNQVSVVLVQFPGSGSSSATIETPLGTFTPNSSWTKFTTIPVTFPSSVGFNIPATGDDAYYIRLKFTTNAQFNINIAKPALYLSDAIPDNDVQVYDQIDSVIYTPRTGDIRTSLNYYFPFGWIPMNDGTIGSANSGASTRASQDAWPLYNLIWSNVPVQWAQMADVNPLIRGTNAALDFINNRPMFLTKALGRVLAGLDSSIIVPFTTSFTVIVGSTVTLNTATSFTSGDPIFVYNVGGTLPTGTIAAYPELAPFNNASVYYVHVSSPTSITIHATLEDGQSGANPFVFTVVGTPTNHIQSALGGYKGESRHLMTINELVSHNHPTSTVAINSGGGGGAGIAFVSSLPTSTQTYNLSIASQGGSEPFNIIQPTAYYNVFIKL